VVAKCKKFLWHAGGFEKKGEITMSKFQVEKGFRKEKKKKKKEKRNK